MFDAENRLGLVTSDVPAGEVILFTTLVLNGIKLGRSSSDSPDISNVPPETDQDAIDLCDSLTNET